MDFLQLKSKFIEIDDSDNIFLLAPLNDISGFFTSNSKLLFAIKDEYNHVYEGIETDYLILQMHIRIRSVKNDQTFGDDYYNVITYNGSIEDENISSFVHLCSIYSNHSEKILFKDFFYSLISLFQLPTEQEFKNAVGLYGELKFMQYALKMKSIDISNSWHKNGTYSKFDFSNHGMGIEVKTSMSSDLKVQIKHSQIFGDNQCILLAIICEKNENGETIEDVIKQNEKCSGAFECLNYSINLAKELKRVSNVDVKETRFCIKEMLFYSAESINPFIYVPDNVTELQYKLDLTELEPLDENKIDELIKMFAQKYE